MNRTEVQNKGQSVESATSTSVQQGKRHSNSQRGISALIKHNKRRDAAARTAITPYHRTRAFARSLGYSRVSEVPTVLLNASVAAYLYGRGDWSA